MNNKGYTLVEIISVCAIISLMATMGLVNLNKMRIEAEQTKTIKELKSLYTAITMYELEKNESPNNWMDLKLYINISKFENEYELITN